MDDSKTFQQVIDLRWGQCAVRSAGQGRPLVFVHGFPMDSRMWQTQMGMVPGWRTIAPDLRGFGQTRADTHVSAICDYADDLASLLEAMETPSAVFVGLSMGGYILFEMWRRHEARISGLVLVATHAMSDSEPVARGRIEASRNVAEVGTSFMVEQMPHKLLSAQAPPPVVDDLRAMIAQSQPRGITSALEAMRMRSDSTDMLASISVPALVVAGKEDTIVSEDQMRTLAAEIPRAEFRTVERAGHVPPLERPDEFNGILIEFLSDF